MSSEACGETSASFSASSIKSTSAFFFSRTSISRGTGRSLMFTPSPSQGLISCSSCSSCRGVTFSISLRPSRKRTARVWWSSVSSRAFSLLMLLTGIICTVSEPRMLWFQFSSMELMDSTPASVTANRKTAMEIITFRNRVELSSLSGSSCLRVMMLGRVLISDLRNASCRDIGCAGRGSANAAADS